jgi:hypothetical protein
MFGGFFGRQVPMKGGVPTGGPLPVAPGSAAGKASPVIGQSHTVPVSGPAAAPTPAPGSFQQAPLIPPTRVPMGAKKDCPICRG